MNVCVRGRVYVSVCLNYSFYYVLFFVCSVYVCCL